MSYPQQSSWQQTTDTPATLPPAGQPEPPAGAPSGLPIGGVTPPPPTNPYHQPVNPYHQQPVTPYHQHQEADGHAPQAAIPQTAHQQQTAYDQQTAYQQAPAYGQQPYPQAAHYPQADRQATHQQQAPAFQQAAYQQQAMAAPGDYQQAAGPYGDMDPPGFSQPARWTPPEPKTPKRWGAAVVSLAGLAAAVGTFMPWVIAYAPMAGSKSLTGFDVGAGRLIGFLGAYVALLGLGFFVARPAQHRYVVSSVLSASMAVTALSGWQLREAWSAEEKARDFVARAGGTDAMVAAIRVDIAPGLWMILAAGAIATLFSLFLFRRR